MSIVIDTNDISTDTGTSPTLGDEIVLNNLFDFKQSVRVATTAAGTLSSDFENGDTIDGVILATNDRILIKDQTTGAENGIYTVNASGSPTRSTDADDNNKVNSCLAVFVEEGTANAEKGFLLTTNNPITVGTTALTFAEFTSAGGVSGDPNYVGEDQTASPSATGTDSLAMGPGAVASFSDSIAIGQNSTATKAAAIAIGQNTDATGANSIAIGGASSDSSSSDATGARSVAIGYSSLASSADVMALGVGAEANQRYSIAVGRYALANIKSQMAFSAGTFSSAGDNQWSVITARVSTTDATVTKLNPAGDNSNLMILRANTAWSFRITLIAREAATGDAFTERFEGLIKRDGANNTTLVGTVSSSRIAEDAGATSWSATVSADDTSEALQIQVTGEAAHTIRWVAHIHISEITG
jgi:trimeric autotransporter adhesin